MLVIDPTLKDADMVIRKSMLKFECHGLHHTKLEIAKKSAPNLIKSKANIEIDPDEGRNMFGVLDETGKLEYGQVFVQYSSDVSACETTPNDTKILKGTVVVTKCPCVHPADVRKFKAVDIPELHHIIDCIVFPQKGHRPHTDEIAGSDMDGDEYAVIFKKELFFIADNYPPPNYPKYTTEKFQNISEFLRESKVEDVINFLVEYIKLDKIGSIASAHLAFADMWNVKHPVCLSIARKHAVAVDFAKTGYTKVLTRNEIPRKYPDFMEKFWKRKYKSRKVLGKLYRVSKDFENENQATAFHYRDIQVDPFLVVDGWQEFEKSAIASRNRYNETLKTILQTYGIHHETEAFGGAFIKLHSRFRERRDRAEIVNIIHIWLKELMKNTKQEFLREFAETGDLNRMNARITKKASAWYIVTYREKYPEFLSFPWVLSEFLANIRILMPDKIGRNPVFYVPLIMKLEAIIKRNAAAGLLTQLHDIVHSFLGAVYFLCERSIVERSISILTDWANEEHIISFVSIPGKKYLFYKTFLKIILYIAEVEGYVSSSPCAVKKKHQSFSSADLCISFFRFCVKLRFCSKIQVRELLPFEVYNDRLLAKRAMVMFHSIAVTGIFPALRKQQCINSEEELVDMKAFPLASAIFLSSPVPEETLQNAEAILLELSGVADVYMRECSQTKKVIVSAYGTVFSLRRLESLLRKNETYLKSVFLTGDIPE